MGWIVIVIICVVLLFLILNVVSSRRAKKLSSRRITAVLPSERSDEETEDSRGEAFEKAPSERTDLSVLEDVRPKYKQTGRQRVSKEATTWGRGEDVTRSHARHDLQKLWKESIKTLFLDELSPAQTYLRKAYEMEKEGADPKKIQDVLEEAYQLDKRATDFYCGRISIIREVRSKKLRR